MEVFLKVVAKKLPSLSASIRLNPYCNGSVSKRDPDDAEWIKHKGS